MFIFRVPLLGWLIVWLAISAEAQPPDQRKAAADYPEGVSVTLGQVNEPNGLSQFDQEPQHVSRAVTMGGRECRATDRANQQYYIDFDVEDEYLFNVNLPVRITVEYYDNGSGYFLIRYDSNDPGALIHGIQKLTERVYRTDSQTWKKYTFQIPDAKFANRNNGADFVLAMDGWVRGQDDLYVSSVHVIPGGLQVAAIPAVAAADGESRCTIHVKVWGQKGPVPDGTRVLVFADRGSVPTEAATQNGEVEFPFVSGTTPGPATILVRAGEDTAQIRVDMLAGTGKIVTGKWVLASFEDLTGWHVRSGGAQQATWEVVEKEWEGKLGPAGCLTYEFIQRGSGQIALEHPTPLPGSPTRVGIWVHGDESHNGLHLELRDVSGQVHHYVLGYINFTGWRFMEHALGPPAYYMDGKNDGIRHLPLSFERLVIIPYSPAPQLKEKGTLFFRDLTFTVDLPESNSVLLEVATDRPDNTFTRGEPVVYHVRLTNLLDQSRVVKLLWSLRDGQGKSVSSGELEPFELAGSAAAEQDISVSIEQVGIYEAVFEATGDVVHTLQTLPITVQ